jgi:hypothetical protein
VVVAPGAVLESGVAGDVVVVSFGVVALGDAVPDGEDDCGADDDAPPLICAKTGVASNKERLSPTKVCFSILAFPSVVRPLSKNNAVALAPLQSDARADTLQSGNSELAPRPTNLWSLASEDACACRDYAARISSSR